MKEKTLKLVSQKYNVNNDMPTNWVTWKMDKLLETYNITRPNPKKQKI